MVFDAYEFFVNDDKTRSFVGLRVGCGHDKVCELINGVMRLCVPSITPFSGMIAVHM